VHCTLSVRRTCSDGGWSVQWLDVGRGQRCTVRCRCAVLAVTEDGQCRGRMQDGRGGATSVRCTCSDGQESVQWQDVGRSRRCAVRFRCAVLAVTEDGQCRGRTYCSGALLASERSSRLFRGAVTKMLSVSNVESTAVTHGSVANKASRRRQCHEDVCLAVRVSRRAHALTHRSYERRLLVLFHEGSLW
jgi:hypothetical protein